MIIDSPTRETIPALKNLWQQAFEDPQPFIDNFFSQGFSCQRCRCVWVDDTLAAALYWFDCQWQNKKLAYLYAVATDRAFQRRGLCRALMADTHAHLKRLGYAGCVLVPASETLFGFYEKLDYRTFCFVNKVRVAPESPVAIRQLDRKEYARLRPAYLPENAVVQNGDTLAFLEVYASFYQTDNSIFCVSLDERTAYFQEFLGNDTCLPGIIGALGAEKGLTRLPGTQTPFAMYHSLTNDPATPGYFGIPLD